MTNKAIELTEAQQELTVLIEELKSAEELSDKALQHAAEYSANNELTERGRDARAESALAAYSAALDKALQQAKLVQQLISSYGA